MKHPLRKQLTEITHLIQGYPEFVYSGNNNLALNGIPVFVFHTIEPNSFESQLIYIKDNGYIPLSINRFYEVIRSQKISTEKYILLTIDDGRSSVWRYAFPLLKKYNMHAVVFIIPGLTTGKTPVRYNLNDVWAKQCTADEIYNLDNSDRSLCNWHEIIEMYKSGLIDIESHTLFHREVFNNGKFKGFIKTVNLNTFYSSPATHYLTLCDTNKDILTGNYEGLPVFETAPLMLCGQKLEISDDFKKISKEIYFNSKGESESKNKIKELLKNNLIRGKYYKILPDTKQEVMEDLNKAREIIHTQLGSDAGNHLCLPWNMGNEQTIDIARKLGIKSCFWGVIPGKGINKPGLDPLYISRLKNDFIFRLPGAERKNLVTIYNHKIKRRIRGDQIY